MNTRVIAREKQLENWAVIIHECKNSGMKTKDWLAQNNISKDQYYYWFRALREHACLERKNEVSTTNEIVQIKCEEPVVERTTSPGMININCGALNISLPTTTDVNTIRAMLEVAVHAK